MQLQVNWFRRVVQNDSYTLLLSLLLYSLHTPPATAFSHRLGTSKANSCPSFWGSACVFFKNIWLQDYANIPGWCSAKPKRREGPGPRKKHYISVQFQMNTARFFMNDAKKNDSKLKKKVWSTNEVREDDQKKRMWVMYSSTPDPRTVSMPES